MCIAVGNLLEKTGPQDLNQYIREFSASIRSVHRKSASSSLCPDLQLYLQHEKPALAAAFDAATIKRKVDRKPAALNSF
jgi:hypothetical protein